MQDSNLRRRKPTDLQSIPAAADSGNLAFPQVEDWDSARFFCAAMYLGTEQRTSGDYRFTSVGLR